MTNIVVPGNKSTKTVRLKESLSLEEAGQADKEESKALQLKEQAQQEAQVAPEGGLAII